jgi:hypothetical protein
LVHKLLKHPLHAKKRDECDERIQGIKKLVWKTGIILKLLALSEEPCFVQEHNNENSEVPVNNEEQLYDIRWLVLISAVT